MWSCSICFSSSWGVVEPPAASARTLRKRQPVAGSSTYMAFADARSARRRRTDADGSAEWQSFSEYCTPRASASTKDAPHVGLLLLSCRIKFDPALSLGCVVSGGSLVGGNGFCQRIAKQLNLLEPIAALPDAGLACGPPRFPTSGGACLASRHPASSRRWQEDSNILRLSMPLPVAWRSV